MPYSCLVVQTCCYFPPRMMKPLEQTSQQLALNVYTSHQRCIIKPQYVITFTEVCLAICRSACALDMPSTASSDVKEASRWSGKMRVLVSELRSLLRCCGTECLDRLSRGRLDPQRSVVAVALGHLHSWKLFMLSQSNQSMHKFPADACRDTVNASALIED